MGHATTKQPARPAPGRADAEQIDVWADTVGARPTRPAGSGDPVRDLLEKNLIKIAQELARKSGRHGVTVCDVRIYAEQRGILTGDERDRTLSWLYQIPRKAGLRSTGGVRPSTRPKAHGNYQRVWVLPEFLPEDAR